MARSPLPDEALVVKSASMDAFLSQERNGEVTLGYGFEIEFHPFSRGEDDVTDEEDDDAEENEEDADEDEDEDLDEEGDEENDEEEVLTATACRLTFQAPLNGARNWKDISGSYARGGDGDNNAFLDFGPGGESNPVDVLALKIQHLSGCEFRVSADFRLLLEAWRSGRADRALHLDFQATFRELTIQTQNFTEDSGVRDLAAFLPKHVDMNAYQKPRVIAKSLAVFDARP